MHNEIIKYCKANGYTIVSVDSDFQEIISLNGHPPKIIWIRSLNMTTNKVVEILIDHKIEIEQFIVSKEYKETSCLEIKMRN